jgi:hypothetical protein
MLAGRKTAHSNTSWGLPSSPLWRNVSDIAAHLGRTRNNHRINYALNAA